LVSKGLPTAQQRVRLGNVIAADTTTDWMALHGFACEEDKFGATKTFETAPSQRATKAFARRQPFYFLFGNNRGPTESMTMKMHDMLCGSVRRARKARIKDIKSLERRQIGWKDWTAN